MALAATPADVRAKKFLKNGLSQAQYFYGLVASPAGGIGIVVGRKDDRFLDTKRKVQVAISGQSRSVFQGFLQYQDKETVSKGRLEGSILVSHEIDQYFGLGPSSQLKDLLELRQTRSSGHLGWRTNDTGLYQAFSLGWFYRDPLQRVSLTYLNERQLSLIPSLEMGFEDRHRLKVFAKVSGAHSSFLSTHSFWDYELGGLWTYPLSERITVESKTRIRKVSTESPYGVLTDLGGNLNLSGLRPGRFRDYFSGYQLISLALRLAQAWDGGIFGAGSVLGADLKASLKNPLVAGGGAFINYGSAPFQSRFEIGHFTQETTILVGGRWVFE